MNKTIKYLRKPSTIIIILMNLGLFNWLPDKIYLKMKYKLVMKEKLNILEPKTFNEKLQWLKLYDRKSKYTAMVDKYEAKNYVTTIIDDKYIIPTIGVWKKTEDINFDDLPNKFVLKPTHTSGDVFICRDKGNLDYKILKKQVNKWLKRKYYYAHREWPYKNIEPKIIAEEYMEDAKNKDLMDYKLFCFNGKVKTILVCSNRNGNYKNTDFYDTDWNLMPFTRENHDNNPDGIKRPKTLNEMIEIAEKLSKDIPFVRVDLYEINEKVFFGELTFYPSAGFEGFRPNEYDKILGDWLKLPKEN